MNRPPSDLPPRVVLMVAGGVGGLFVGLYIYAASASFGPVGALGGVFILSSLIIAGAALAGTKGLSRLQLLLLTSVAAVAFETAGTVAVIVDDGSGEQRPRGVAQPTLAERGSALVKDFACLGCHTTSGAKSVGPSWHGLYGSDRQVKGKGKGKIVVDREYLVRSIVDPDAEIASGYPRG